MRILGPKASLRRHEQDVLFSGAACKAHSQQEVKDIGEELFTQRHTLKERRDGLEAAEDAVVIADALVTRTDVTRDKTLVSLGAFADALGLNDRARLFRLPPSDIARLGNDKETTEIGALITKVQAYVTDHPIREAYEARLVDENAAFVQAAASQDEAEQQLVAARFAVTSTKLANDELRQRCYGKLVTLLGKPEAETFFRNWSATRKKADPTPTDPTPTA
jgi:hypothetical protein